MYTYTLYTHNPAAGPSVEYGRPLYTHWYTVNHRDYMVINTGAAIISTVKTTVKESFEQSSG